MRIISGSAGGIPLQAPKHDARPSTDRLRSALFSILGDSLEGKAVVDLFAGSGALGLEALSRGAERAVFVDSHSDAIKAIKANATKAKLADRADIRQVEVQSWLSGVGRQRLRYDVVFADPPYCKGYGDIDLAKMLIQSVPLQTILRGGGLLVVETQAERQPLAAPAPWVIEDTRTYGSSQITFLRCQSEA